MININKLATSIYFLSLTTIVSLLFTHVRYLNFLINRYLFSNNVTVLEENFLNFYHLQSKLLEWWIPLLIILTSVVIVSIYSYYFIVTKKTSILIKLIAVTPFIQLFFFFIYLIIESFSVNCKRKYLHIFIPLILIIFIVMGWYWNLLYIKWLASRS